MAKGALEQVNIREPAPNTIKKKAFQDFSENSPLGRAPTSSDSKGLSLEKGN